MKKFIATGVALLSITAVAVAPNADAAKKPKKKPIVLKVKSGTAKTTFTAEFIKALVDNGVAPNAIAPGTVSGDGGLVTLTLPVTGGKVKAKGKSATIQAAPAAGQILTKGTDTREITNIVTKVKGSKTTVVADAGGTILGVPGVTFLRGTGATFKLTKKSFKSSGELVLSDEAAADLSTNFGITNLPAGTVIGTGTVSVKGKSKS